jgi:hypothetical protein
MIQSSGVLSAGYMHYTLRTNASRLGNISVT